MTHKEIAQIAHVSVSTVSKALSGSKEVSEEVASEIRRIAMEIGYFKKKNKRKIESISPERIRVAIICPEIISIFYSRCVEMLKSEIEDRGGSVIVHISDFGRDNVNKMIDDIVIKGDAEGVILLKEPGRACENIPIVVFGDSQTVGSVGVVYNSIDLLMNYLYELGHRKIGYAGEFYTVDKNNHFIEFLDKYGLEYNPDYCIITDKRFEKSGFLAAKKYLESEDRPTAIIAAYDEIALGMIFELKRNGIRIPEDVSIVGIDDIPYASYSQPPLTTVRLYGEERCRLAVNMLYDKIFGDSDTIQHVFAENKLIVRDSAASPRKED